MGEGKIDTHSENEMDGVTSDDYSTINLKQKSTLFSVSKKTRDVCFE